MNIHTLHILRILLTLIILPVFYYQKCMNVFILVLLLWILDVLDCNSLLQSDSSYCKTYEYQKNDKVIDLLSYIYAVLLFNYLFDDQTIVLLILFICWRGIGVYNYYFNNNNGYIYYYPDFINITMLIYFLSTQSKIIKHNYYIVLFIGMCLKIGFERIYHIYTYK